MQHHRHAVIVLALVSACGDDPAPAPPVDATVVPDADATVAPDADVATPPYDAGPCDPRRALADGGSAFSDVLPMSCGLPNIIPVVENIQIQTRVFGAGACEVAEGCALPGRRRLLRFDLITPNIGTADLYLGPPNRDNRPDDRFEFGTCHAHWHFRGYADYRLLDGTGREVGRGHKQSFCLLDSARYRGMGQDVPGRQQYSCADQGIHAGWYDLYDRNLDCQYVDITDVPAGNYRVRVRINEGRGLVESRYDDNEALVAVTIPPADADAGTGSVNPTDACPDDSMDINRDCGWIVERGSTCEIGQMVTVGCNSACTPGLGDCVGNPMIRVCAGDGPCTRALSLVSNDDACGTQCPHVSFMCPFRGRFTVLTGGARAGSAYECRIAVRQ